MKKKPQHLICLGNMLLFVLIFSGCGGGSAGGGGSSGSSASATPTSSVGGTVVGLVGSGLVLQNNGTDDLAITVDQTTFKFKTRVREGSTANVTILTQPVAPAQTCTVINGSMVVGQDNVTDVEVKCSTSIYETFGNSKLSSGYWNSSGQYDRKLVDSKLQVDLTATDEFAFDQLPFQNKTCDNIAADVNIANTDFTGTGVKDFLTELNDCGYHSSLVGEAPGTSTGDVKASIIWDGTDAFYQVFRCLNDDCDNADSIEYLTPNGSAGVLLGTVAQNSTPRLSIDWNNTQYPDKFSFQINNELPKIFDPVQAGAPIASPVPNKPEKHLGTQIYLSNSGDRADMTATFDNVTDGTLSDNFDTEKYISGSFWKKTDGRRQIENGKLVLQTAQGYTGDPTVDNRLNGATSLHSKFGMIIKGAEDVEADMALDPATFVVDNGGNPAQVFALLGMEYRPAASSKNDFTNFFVIRAALKEGPDGVDAVVLAEGCADYSCSTHYNIAGGSQIFSTPVAAGQTHHFKIAHQGNGLFDVTMDGTEALTVDLSSIPGFSSTTFSGVVLRTATQGTDKVGEEAFVKALFDNVQAGSQ